MTPFVTLPGETPRKVVIERKKRLFAEQDIAALLEREGIAAGLDAATGKGLLGAVPLELFDDSEYDTRTPEEWLAVAKATKPGSSLAPAKGLIAGRWVPCAVTGYSEQTRRFTVVREDTHEQTSLPKVLLLFSAEDPFAFVARVKAALAARAMAEAQLRYQSFVASMPLDDAQISKERAAAILMLACNTERMRGLRGRTKHLLQEASRDLSVATNKLVFASHWRGAAEWAFDARGPEALDLPSHNSAAAATCSRLERAQSFELLRNDFLLRSFFSRTETVSVLLKVRQECLTVAQSNAFVTRITKSFRLEEFEQLQVSNMTTFATVAVRDTWISMIRNAVTNSLKGLGKGWYNLDETRREVYEISRLKKFFDSIRFMMEDALHFMMEDSLANFATFFELASDNRVVVAGPREVTVQRSLAAFEAFKFPLFTVDLLADDARGVHLSQPLTSFWERAEALCDKMLSIFGGITTIERIVMTKLFWSETPTLVTVGKGEPSIAASIERIRRALSAATSSLEVYVASYSKYSDLLAINVESYLREFSEKEHSLEEYRQEATRHLAARDAIERDVPLDANVGMFLVNTSHVFQHLHEKCRVLASGILDSLTRASHTTSVSIAKEFEGVMRQLEERATSVEMLAEQKAFVAGLPTVVKQLQRKVDTVAANYALLEDFGHALSPEHFNLRWGLVEWPTRILAKADDAVLVHERDRSIFFKQYGEARAAFEEKLKDISQAATTVMRISDLSQHETAVVQIAHVQQSIRDAQEQIRVFNRRERLFGLDQSSYPEFQTLVKQSEPYCKLWVMAHDWIASYDRWMSEPFSQLRVETVEEMLLEGSKTMYKLAEHFRDSP
jgi:dynein heavy chain